MTTSNDQREAVAGAPALPDGLSCPAGIEPVPVSTKGFNPSQGRGAFEIGFTGSSARCTQAQRDTLTTWLIAFREVGAIWQHNGDCVESDRAAGDIWHAIGGKISLHPPINPSKRAFLTFDETAEPKEYLARNQDIVDACHVLVATPFEFETQRSGTWATIRRARKAGKPRLIIWPNGSILQEAWPAEFPLRTNPLGADNEAGEVTRPHLASLSGRVL